MRPLVREPELMKQLIEPTESQVNPPLLLDQCLGEPGRPLISSQPIIRWRLVQHNKFQHLASGFRQHLGNGASFRGQQRVKAAMPIEVEPTLQGLPADLLRPADVGERLAVPDRFQCQQSPRCRRSIRFMTPPRGITFPNHHNNLY